MLFAFFGMAQTAKAVCYAGGTLTTQSNVPVSGVTFNLSDGSSVVDTSTTDANGNFQLSTRTGGTYYVFANNSNGLEYLHVNNGQYGGFYTFNCIWQGNFQTDWVAVQEPVPFAGQVYNSLNQGLANRTVRLHFGNGAYQDYTTDSSGNFSTVLGCYRTWTLELLARKGDTSITAVNQNGGGSSYVNISCSFAQNTGLDFLVQ